MKKEVFQDQLVCLIEDCIEEGEVDKEAVEHLVDGVYQVRKCCSSCTRLLPANKKYFAKHSRTRDKLQSYCRDCGNQRTNARKAQKRKESSSVSSFDYQEHVKDYADDLAAIDYKE